MSKLVFTVLPILAIALVLGASAAMAQDNVYDLSYYSNANTTGAPDGVLRLVNDGNLSATSPAGDVCAAIYVFDNREELNECCSCKITPNGLLALSVNKNLTNNTLTGKIPTRGVIKVLSSVPVAGVCDPTVSPVHIGIRGWLTHIQQVTATSFAQTEEELTDSTLGAAEYADLIEDCSVEIELGSGQGQCFCTDSGQ
jgi:hypothetical protein